VSPEKATLKDGRTIDFLPEVIGDGAMKQAHFTPDRRSVVCFYKKHDAGMDQIKARRLDAILGKYNPTLSRSRGGAAASEAEANYFHNLFCWPTDIVVAPRFGLIAPTYPDRYFFRTGPDFIQGREKNGMRFIGRKNRKLLQADAPAELGDWKGYLALCIRMARAVSRLHMAGLAHSDLSPNNVLVDPTTGSSIVIDIDSLVVENLYPPDVLGTKGYIAPEVLSTVHLPMDDPARKHANARTDQHALAVLIYQYLLLRHPLDGRKIPAASSAEEQELLSYGSEALFCEHPHDVTNRPETSDYVPCSKLGPHLNDLFERAFARGLHIPEDRPTAMEWQGGLIRTWDLLMPCDGPGCSQKWFVMPERPPISCPFCGARPRQRTPILKLSREIRPGQLSLERKLVVYNNIPIYKWHVSADTLQGPEADATPQGDCVFHEGRWFLRNQCMESMTSPSGLRVGPNQYVELSGGASFRLGKGPDGRIAEVQFL
jgi:Protein kinase domain